MCLAVPVRVVEVPEEGKARVQVGSGENFMDISTLLLPEAPRPGDYVIVHAGFALRTLDAAEAEESIRIFRQIAELGVNEGRALEQI
ncbi:HypC/HybG/HupF family hydrogenase formation chaperone [uncultured Mailhella sp.]|uniref:HypC/HybG/HupF family hydrogenase formation chaperone n=1 Tax=uncultured Mailhella sp. TaxID=1981031 RepID=UPI0025FFCD02|nr:HypC/HybG/HupF family hydrogenase formation chaperone [uncultured Mailhella sp.]